MNTLSVSSYSLREQLGSIQIAFTDAAGHVQTFRQDFPQLMDIVDFPTKGADSLDMTAVETVAFQYDGIDDVAIDRFAANAGSAGLELLNAAVDEGDLLSTDADRRVADVAALKDWIGRFASAGYRFVRVNPGSPFSTNHGSVPPAYLVEALRELGEHANAQGVRLLVENHGGPSSDPAWLNELLDAVGQDKLGLLLDLGNFDALLGPLMATMFAEPGATPPLNPFEGADMTSVYEGINALAGRAELVHVKVYSVDAAGIGPVDIPRALQILAGHGYTGALTVEYEGVGGDPWDKTQRILDLITAESRPFETPNRRG